MTRRLWTAALFLGAICVSLLIGEVAVRALRPEFALRADQYRNPFWVDGSSFWQYDDIVGWRHRAGAEGTFKSSEFSHRVRINSSGWRDRERTTSKRPGIWRVAVVGDSFTWGPGVRDEEVYTRQMEELLPGTEVLNFGLSATATDQQLLILRRTVLSYAPDLVLLMVCRNDFDGVIESMQGSYYKPFFVLDNKGALVLKNQPVPKVSRMIRVSAWLKGVSALANLLGTAQLQLESRSTRSAETTMSEPFALMRALLKTMRDESERTGALFAVALAPSDSHVYPDTIPSLEQARMGLLEEVTETEGIPYLNLVPSFRDAARRTNSEGRLVLHFPIDRHWNLDGHTLAARELARLLQEHHLIGPAAAASSGSSQSPS